MMTMLVATLGLLPAAMSHDIGSDSQRPFAIVIVGGLIVELVVSVVLMAHPLRFLGAPRRPVAPVRTGIHGRRRARGLGWCGDGANALSKQGAALLMMEWHGVVACFYLGTTIRTVPSPLQNRQRSPSMSFPDPPHS